MKIVSQLIIRTTKEDKSYGDAGGGERQELFLAGNINLINSK